MPENILADLLLIFGVSTFVVILFHWLKQPPIAGYLLSGMILGPYGLKWISELERVHNLAEIGIILLLFSLGIEFSLPHLLRSRRSFLGVGGLQCIITTLAFMATLRIMDFSMTSAFVLGSMASLSSTAIVLKLLHQNREIASPHGNLSVSVLLFQDLWVIPLMIILPLLGAGTTLGAEERITLIVAKMTESIIWIGIVLLSTKYIVPFLLKLAAQTRIRELFLIAVAFISLGCAWFMGSVGLSMALGAFIGGMMISGSDYGHQAVSETVPFRDPFLALFFVSIGMLLDFSFFTSHLHWIVLLAAGVIITKFVVTASVASLLGIDSRVAALTAISLSQIGEFSFVLAERASTSQLIRPDDYQYFLAVTLVLMTLTPLLLQLAPKLAPFLSRYDVIGKQVKKGRHPTEPLPSLKDHAMIIGFGIIGRDLARHFSEKKLPFSIIELNLQSVKEAKSSGLPIQYGDASRREVLEAAGIHEARAVIIVINDARFIPRIIHAIRSVRPEVPILARVNFVMDANEMNLPGPTEFVIAETEVLERILLKATGFFHTASP